MPMQDVLREARERQEDKFIDRCEAAINAGRSFDEEFKPGWDIDLRSPEWRSRFERMEADAKPYRQYHKAWSADAVRKKIMDLRKAARDKESDDAFYRSNLGQMKDYIETGKTFNQTDLPEMMKPYFLRAEKELLGYNREETPAPAVDPFLTGFSAD